MIATRLPFNYPRTSYSRWGHLHAGANCSRHGCAVMFAPTSGPVIEQAKGVIAERAGIDLAEAFSRLRRDARSRNLRLTDVAEAAIVGSLDPQAWAPARRSAPPIS